MKRFICLWAGIFGSLVGLICMAAQIEKNEPGEPTERLALAMKVISYPLMGFLIPYAVMGFLVYKREERIQHYKESASGWQGIGAFATLFLFAGHFQILFHDFSNILQWCITLFFLCVCVYSTRAYLYATTGYGYDAASDADRIYRIDESSGKRVVVSDLEVFWNGTLVGVIFEPCMEDSNLYGQWLPEDSEASDDFIEAIINGEKLTVQIGSDEFILIGEVSLIPDDFIDVKIVSKGKSLHDEG